MNATAPLSVGGGRVFYDDGVTAYTVVYPGADGEVDAGDAQLSRTWSATGSTSRSTSTRRTTTD